MCVKRICPSKPERLAVPNFRRRRFRVWLAGGGVKPGVVYGETDGFSYNIVRDPVSLFDLNATMLHCLGIDHAKFTFKSQGLDQRLTGVEPARVVREILS